MKQEVDNETFKKNQKAANGRVIISTQSYMPMKAHHVSEKRATDHPIRTKILAWACLSCVQIIAASVLKLSQQDGQYKFSPESSLVMSETIKLGLSVAYLLRESGGARTTGDRIRIGGEDMKKVWLTMFCLAVMYSVNNGVTFWLFLHADPGSITLIKSGGTIVSAVVLFVWRNFRLSFCRWTVIVIQVLGLIVAQYDSCAGKPYLEYNVYVMLWFCLLNSSVANVWNEHAVKKFQTTTLAMKNVALYFFGTCLNLAAFIYGRRRDAESPGFFEGYSLLAVAVVASNALMGIGMNVVYKYADALVKNIATTTSTVVVLILSVIWFDGRGGMMVFVGVAVVVLTTFLYFTIGVLETKIKK